ncbi:hypothetical protein ZPAH1_orf00108 [Aeromonas phage ZPAH1]|nr:hypothetical protein ZPAH1_orf00108 [Aeromonas phage ZPAH1]
MEINELLTKEDLTTDESLFVLNHMVDLLYNQIENQKQNIKIMEDTIKSHHNAITELQLAMTTLYEQFDTVKEASNQLGSGGFNRSESGIIF